MSFSLFFKKCFDILCLSHIHRETVNLSEHRFYLTGALTLHFMKFAVFLLPFVHPSDKFECMKISLFKNAKIFNYIHLVD